MNLNWSNRVIKFVLLVFNFFFVISGIIFICVGVTVKSFYNDYDIFLNDSYFSLPNLLIAIGVLIFIISFFGCCGALKESWFMIFIFSILLGLIFILEFSAGIAGYVLRDQTTSYLSSHLKSSIKDYTRNPVDNKISPETYVWDLIQRDFECCGADSPDDWKTPPPSSKQGNDINSNSDSGTDGDGNTTATTTSITTTTVSSTTATATTTNTSPPTTTESPQDPSIALPGSCCRSKPGMTGDIHCSKDSPTAIAFTKGCVSQFGSYIKEHAVTLGGVGIAFAFIQLFGVIFACHLTKQLKHGFYST